MNLVDQMRQVMRGVQQRNTFEELQTTYDAYRVDPGDGARVFGTLRALIRWCRWHKLTIEHAALFAELARVDDEAPLRWQLLLQHRAPTRPHRDKKERENKRSKKFRTQERQWQRFLAVMDRIEAEDALPVACAAVAKAEGKNVQADTVRLDYLAIAGQYRRAGRDTVEMGDVDALRRIPLPRPGRPRKKG